MLLGATFALLATLVALIVSWFYLTNRRTASYWRQRGVTDGLTWEEIKRMWLVVLGRWSVAEAFRKVYERSRSPCVWYLSGDNYALVIRDPGLLEDVLVKEFTAFHDRGMPNQNESVLDLGLVSLTGRKWKVVRSKISPAFTTGKLRHMIRGMVDSSSKALGRDLTTSEDLDVMQHVANYAVDTIGSVVFGLSLDSASVPRFRQMSRRMSEPDMLRWLRILMLTYLPRLSRRLGLKFADEEAVEYFREITRSAFESKRDGDEDEGRKDFVGLLMQLKEKGRVELRLRDTEEEDSYLDIGDPSSTNNDTLEFTDELLFAQAFQFLTAGLEGTSLTMTYLLHELAQNQHIQKTLRAEIEDVLYQNYGQLTYDAIKKMEYLHRCVMETLRKYPPGGMLVRMCVRQCHLRGGLRIDPKTQIVVPVWGIHWDPNYYPQPEEFRPERFTPEEITKRPKNTFLAFGDGPRICIGMRFVLLEIKIGIVTLLTRYQIEPSPKTKLPIEFSTKHFLTAPKSPIFVKLKKLNHDGAAPKMTVAE